MEFIANLFYQLIRLILTPASMMLAIAIFYNCFVAQNPDVMGAHPAF